MTVSLYPVFCAGRKRRGRFKATSDVQQRLNEHNAREHVARLLHANFTEEDVWLHLTFDDAHLPEGKAGVLRAFRNFKGRLGRAIKREQGEELKYVAIPEGTPGGERFHIHMVTNARLTAATLAALWGQGFIRIDPLKFGPYGLTGLSEYMQKGHAFARILRSRNLEDPAPVEKTGRVSRSEAARICDEAWDHPEKFNELYPGWAASAVRPFYNNFNRYFYLRVYLYRPKGGAARAV
jgi:hypothetical protein